MKIFILALLLLFQLSCHQASESSQASLMPVWKPEQKADNGKTSNIVFRSTDGGRTWQDISAGLPKPTVDDYGFASDGFFSNDNGVFLTAGEEIYHSTPDAKAPFWNKEISGISWKQVRTGGERKMVESNGVLLATSNNGIIRSTDDGETWSLVISEGGVGIDVAKIRGGFAAITYSSASKARRVRTSYDGGQTWQPIDAGLPASLSISSIIQVGEDFFCGHPKGIYKSSDKGKTWELLLPSVEGKVFNLSVSGDVIYAVPKNGGC